MRIIVVSAFVRRLTALVVVLMHRTRQRRAFTVCLPCGVVMTLLRRRILRLSARVVAEGKKIFAPVIVRQLDVWSEVVGVIETARDCGPALH